MSRVAQWWREQQYDPGWIGIVVNPHYFARLGLRRALGSLLSDVEGELLDIGCGRKPYQHMTRARRYVGVDIDSEVTRALAKADVFYDGHTLPFAACSFDAALCSQVLEHVFNPDDFVSEIARVLRPGGVLILSVPFVWDEHEQPRDFGRYSSFGLRALLERHGFEIAVQRKVTIGPRAIAQVSSNWLFKLTSGSNRWLSAAAQITLIFPINLCGLIAGAVLPAGADFYLDNVVLAKRAGRGM